MDRLGPIELAIDSGSVTTAAQIHAGNDALKFVRMAGPRPNLAFVEDSCWVRLHIQFQPDAEEHWYLGLAYPLTDRIDLYVYENQMGPPSEQHGGDRLPFHARPVDHRFFLFPLERPDQGRLEILLRLESQDTMELPLALIPEGELVSWTGRDQVLNGLYFGLLLAMLIYNLALYVWVWDRVYLFYAGYLIALALYMLAELGLGYQYLWPDSPGLQARAVGAFAPLAILAGAVFSASYLETKQRDRFAHGVFFAIVILQLVLIVDTASPATADGHLRSARPPGPGNPARHQVLAPGLSSGTLLFIRLEWPSSGCGDVRSGQRRLRARQLHHKQCSPARHSLGSDVAIPRPRGTHQIHAQRTG